MPPRKTALLVLLLGLFGVGVGLGGTYLDARSDAIADARQLARMAGKLITRGEGGAGLGDGREAMLLMVEDPSFAHHSGIAPLTRSLANQLAVDSLERPLSRIRRAGYAAGLERQLSNAQILTVWLETVEMGGTSRGWIKGFYAASRAVYRKPPSQLSEDQFLRLLAAATSPVRYRLDGRDPALEARVEHVRAVLAGRCTAAGPAGHEDDGCTAT